MSILWLTVFVLSLTYLIFGNIAAIILAYGLSLIGIYMDIKNQNKG